jgi:hypothetical protein
LISDTEYIINFYKDRLIITVDNIIWGVESSAT